MIWGKLPLFNDCDYFRNCDIERAVLHRVCHPETRGTDHEIATMANGANRPLGWEITEANRLMENGDTEGRLHRLPRHRRYPCHRRPLPETRLTHEHRRRDLWRTGEPPGGLGPRQPAPRNHR